MSIWWTTAASSLRETNKRILMIHKGATTWMLHTHLHLSVPKSASNQNVYGHNLPFYSRVVALNNGQRSVYAEQI